MGFKKLMRAFTIFITFTHTDDDCLSSCEHERMKFNVQMLQRQQQKLNIYVYVYVLCIKVWHLTRWGETVALKRLRQDFEISYMAPNKV